jgi:UDP-N-acetylglucosamine acyltransferase
MGYVHIAHDCQIGNNVILASNAQIAGHCHLGDWVILGGMTGVHQFVHIGAHAMTGGGTILFQDVPPYVMASGSPAKTFGINTEGLRRRGFSDEGIAALRRAYKTIYRNGLSLAEAIGELAGQQDKNPELKILVDFLQHAKRGILR